jgi:hypothetical protein
MKEGRFGFLEGLSLTIIVLVSKVFYTSPMMLIKELGTAAWLGTLVSCWTSGAFFLLLYLLMKRFPGQDLFQIFELVAGKVAGRAFILLFSLYFLYYTAISIREFTSILKAYSFPYTPVSMIVIPMMLVMTAMVYVGLEGIARVAYVFVYPIFGGLFLIFILAYPFYHWEYLQPLRGYGLGTTVVTGFLRASAYDEIIILAVIINSIQGLKTFRKAGVSALVISGITISLCTACILRLFSLPQAASTFPACSIVQGYLFFTFYSKNRSSIFVSLGVFRGDHGIGSFLYCRQGLLPRVSDQQPPAASSFLFVSERSGYLPAQQSLRDPAAPCPNRRQYSFLLIYMVPAAMLLLDAVLKRRGGKLHEKQ